MVQTGVVACLRMQRSLLPVVVPVPWRPCRMMSREDRREQCQTISLDLVLDHRLAINDLTCVTCTHSSRPLTKTEP